MVKGHFLFWASNQFKPVVWTVPIDVGLEVQLVTLTSSFIHLTSYVALKCRKQLGGLLVLFIILRTIKRVRTKTFRADACMPFYVQVIVAIATLIKSLTSAVISIECIRLSSAITVRASKAGTEGWCEMVDGWWQRNASCCRKIAKRATLYAEVAVPFLISHL